MTDNQPTSIYGYNFENHPILNKLSAIDRIAFSAELATEFNAAYATGYNAALVGLSSLIQIVDERNREDMSEETRRALLIVNDLVYRLNEMFLDLYRNPEKTA